jgi:hypothetical protein
MNDEPTAYAYTLYGVWKGELKNRQERVSFEHPEERYDEIEGLHPRNIRPLYEYSTNPPKQT